LIEGDALDGAENADPVSILRILHCTSGKVWQ